MAPSTPIFLIFSLLFSFILVSEAQTSLPISSVGSQDPDNEIKCGSCPCSNPCVQQLPPSPPPPPPPYCNQALLHPPPSPRFTYTTLPSSPPPPRFIYTTGVPGNLYQFDENHRWYYFSGATGRKRPAMAALVVALGCGALDLMLFGLW